MIRRRRSPQSRLRLLAAAALFAASIPAAKATTIVVNQTADPFGSDGLCSLREAMSAAAFNLAVDGCPAGSAGFDVVQLAAATYALRGSIVLGAVDPFLLLGQGRAVTTIQPEPGNNARLFDFHDGTVATLADLRLANATRWSATSSEYGGAIRALNADLTLRGVIFLANRASVGGGLSFQSFSGPHTLRVETCSFGLNRADESPAEPGAAGGALYLELLAHASSAFILDTEFIGNSATGADTGLVGGGALFVQAGSDVQVEIRRAQFAQNQAATTGAARVVGALSAGIAVDAQMTLQDVNFYGNDTDGGLPGSATAMSAVVFGALSVERAAFVDEDQGEDMVHVGLEADDGGAILLRSVLLADGPTFGLRLFTALGGTMSLGHLTVSGHPTYGVVVESDGTTRLENSILWQNGTNLQSSGAVAPALTADLIGIDPHFVGPGDYRLAADSPALDTGSDTAATMGFLDLVHGPRKIGPHTDRGAYERRAIFADDWSSGDSTAWQNLPF